VNWVFFYRLSGVVLLGGSLVPHGGHNPIEPSQLDCAIIAGPHMHHFAQMVDDLAQARAIKQLTYPQDCGEALLGLLRDQEEQEAMAKRAHECVDMQRGATQQIADAITQRMQPEATPQDNAA
jgi:3-deoxy-D-manno-octulosonic-acid transferase